MKENDEAFERVAQALLLIETLDGDQFNDLYEGKVTPEELAESVKAHEEKIAELNMAEAKESERLEEERRREAEEKLKELQSVLVGELKFEDSTFAEGDEASPKSNPEEVSGDDLPEDVKPEVESDAQPEKAEPSADDEIKNDAEADEEQ